MTKEEQNNIILDVWQKHLMQKDSLPESIADTFSNWLRAKIKQASAMLTQAQQQPSPGEEMGQDQSQNLSQEGGEQ